jgi:hypothetical protein
VLYQLSYTHRKKTLLNYQNPNCFSIVFCIPACRKNSDCRIGCATLCCGACHQPPPVFPIPKTGLPASGTLPGTGFVCPCPAIFAIDLKDLFDYYPVVLKLYVETILM